MIDEKVSLFYQGDVEDCRSNYSTDAYVILETKYMGLKVKLIISVEISLEVAGQSSNFVKKNLPKVNFDTFKGVKNSEILFK